MLITPANMSTFFLGLHASWASAYETTPVWTPKVATILPSATEIEQYGWIGRIPTLREWIGPRQVKGAAAESLTVRNKTFELTLEADRFKLADDTYGVYTPMVQQMGWQSAKWSDQQIVANIIANADCTDGTAMFGDSHPVDVYNPAAGTFDNNFALTLTPTNYNTVRSAMGAYVGQDGQPLGVSPNLLMVPPQLEEAARQILNADMIPNAAGTAPQTNTLKGSAELLVIPELAVAATTWYLLDTRMPIKPFGWQLREAPQMVARVSPTDPAVFDRHVFVYGVEARGAAVNLFPFLAARSTP